MLKLKAYTYFCDAMYHSYGYERSVKMLAERLAKTDYLSNEFYDAMTDLYLMRYRHGKYPCLYEWTEFVHYFRTVK
jgi:hypothetical protein